MITGKLIKKMREEAGLTQQQLADLVGITQAHIAKIENEKVNPRLSTINGIMSVLKANRKVRSKDLITKDIIFVKPRDSIDYITRLMRENNISQLPVIDEEKCVGCITERTILRNLDSISKSTRVKELMDESCPIISLDDDTDVVKTLLEYHQAVLVSERGKIIGIITKSDLLNLLK
jgi:predicted transcriptional regulator